MNPVRRLRMRLFPSCRHCAHLKPMSEGGPLYFECTRAELLERLERVDCYPRDAAACQRVRGGRLCRFERRRDV